MTFALIFLANALCAFTLIAVHESGHFIAGRLGGIRRRDMRIRLLVFPQHVVLRDGDEWVPPSDHERYLGLMRRYLGSERGVYFYTAGGLILETVFSLLAVVVAKSSGYPNVALMIAGQSLCLYLIYLLLMDVPMTLRTGCPWGDVSGMWFIARAPTLLLAVALLVIRGLLLWYALA